MMTPSSLFVLRSIQQYSYVTYSSTRGDQGASSIVCFPRLNLTDDRPTEKLVPCSLCVFVICVTKSEQGGHHYTYTYIIAL